MGGWGEGSLYRASWVLFDFLKSSICVYIDLASLRWRLVLNGGGEEDLVVIVISLTLFFVNSERCYLGLLGGLSICFA